MTYDFFFGQLRLLIVSLLTFAAGRGWLTPKDAGELTAILAPLGAIALPVLWSWSANWRKKYVPFDSVAIDASAVTEGTPRPGCHVAVKGVQLANEPRTILKVVGALAFFFLACPPLHAQTTPCTPTACTGLYAGFGLGGNGSNANIIGNGINGSVFAGGVMPAFDAGYLYKSGNWLFGAEVDAGYQLVSGVNVGGVGVNENGFFSYQLVKVGGDISALFGSQAPVTIPPSLANSLISLYAQLGIAEHQFAGGWATGFASGAGALFDIGPNSFIDLSYLNVQYNSSVGALDVGQQNIVKVSFNYKFQ